jgi:3-hydroxyisobutyrate dehydrogenase-like beta-hydroxyacid dehydrogenase
MMIGLIGFIGLGAMGLPMVARLARAGNHVVVFDRDIERMKQAIGLPGVHVAENVQSVARSCSVLLSCLPSVQAVEDVYCADGGVLRVLAPGSLVVECSTVGAGVARALAVTTNQAGSDFVEAPLFGAEARASSGELFMLLGGEDAAVARAVPVLSVLAREWMHFGPAGAANAVKTAQNGLGLVQASAIAVALASVQQAGIDPLRFAEAVMRAGGMAASPLLNYLAPRMLAEETPAFPAHAHIMLKDITLALQMAANVSAGSAILSATRDFIAGIQEGRFSDDGFQAMWRLATRAGQDLSPSTTSTETT